MALKSNNNGNESVSGELLSSRLDDLFFEFSIDLVVFSFDDILIVLFFGAEFKSMFMSFFCVFKYFNQMQFSKTGD